MPKLFQIQFMIQKINYYWAKLWIKLADENGHERAEEVWKY